MKTTNYILIGGGAVALFLLWQKNKNKNVITSTTGASNTNIDNTKPSVGASVGNGGQVVSQPIGGTSASLGAVVRDLSSITLFNPNNQTPTFPAPISNQPEQVYGLTLPASMDLPVLTAGTGVPTEVAVQQGGVVTTPTPAIVPAPVLTTQEALNTGGVRPIKEINSGLTLNIKSLE
jgi:hypothetical protein